jgi:hypothetical protein
VTCVKVAVLSSGAVVVLTSIISLLFPIRIYSILYPLPENDFDFFTHNHRNSSSFSLAGCGFERDVVGGGGDENDEDENKNQVVDREADQLRFVESIGDVPHLVSNVAAAQHDGNEETR